MRSQSSGVVARPRLGTLGQINGRLGSAILKKDDGKVTLRLLIRRIYKNVQLRDFNFPKFEYIYMPLNGTWHVPKASRPLYAQPT